jgi:hypothetical protein
MRQTSQFWQLCPYESKTASAVRHPVSESLFLRIVTDCRAEVAGRGHFSELHPIVKAAFSPDSCSYFFFRDFYSYCFCHDLCSCSFSW